MLMLSKFEDWSGELDVSHIQWWHIDKKVYPVFKVIVSALRL